MGARLAGGAKQLCHGFHGRDFYLAGGGEQLLLEGDLVLLELRGELLLPEAAYTQENVKKHPFTDAHSYHFAASTRPAEKARVCSILPCEIVAVIRVRMHARAASLPDGEGHVCTAVCDCDNHHLADVSRPLSIEPRAHGNLRQVRQTHCIFCTADPLMCR